MKGYELLHRIAWERLHGQEELTETWRNLGWVWQPAPCRCVRPCSLSIDSKKEEPSKAERERSSKIRPLTATRSEK